MNKDIVSFKTFLAYSLGCRTNQAEIDSIGLQLTNYGLPAGKAGLRTTAKTPDLVLLNTCVVTQKAEKETRKAIRHFRKLYPKAFLAVLGCAVDAKKKFDINLPKADLFVPNEDKHRITNILEELFSPVADNEQLIGTPSKYLLSGRKFIKIQEGCDYFCSFCLTTHLRGKPKSIPPAIIIEEIKYWLQKGAKEIILTGTNIALYGKDLKEKINLIDLINLISNQTRAERISLSSIYPEMLSEKFVKTIIYNPRISQYFHLSLQSGSESVLERMNRKTDTKKLLKTLKSIKKQNPIFTFRADIIVGFPRETERELQETLGLLKEAKISFAHIFPYSKRIGTSAFNMEDLPEKIKKERAGKIMKVIKAIRQKEAKVLLNKTSNCLIIRENEGITDNGWPIQIRIMNKESRIMNNKGKILPVKITGFKNDQLLGEILSLPT